MKFALTVLILGLAACAETPAPTAVSQKAVTPLELRATPGSTVQRIGNITVITGDIR